MITIKKRISHLVIICFLGYIILPLVGNLILSLSNVWQWPNLLPKDITLHHYDKIFSNQLLYDSLKSTFIIGVMVIGCNLIIALPGAYAMSRYHFKYKSSLLIFICLPLITPPLLILMSLYDYFIKVGLTESYIGVIISHMIPSLPYMFVILYLGFNEITNSFEKQFLSLGIPFYKGFFNIILPQMKVSIILGSIMSFLISVSQYLSTLLIGGGRIQTLSVLLLPYVNGGNIKIGAGYSIVLIAFCFIFIALYEHFLLGGTKYANHQKS